MDKIIFAKPEAYYGISAINGFRRFSVQTISCNKDGIVKPEERFSWEEKPNEIKTEQSLERLARTVFDVGQMQKICQITPAPLQYSIPVLFESGNFKPANNIKPETENSIGEEEMIRILSARIKELTSPKTSATGDSKEKNLFNFVFGEQNSLPIDIMKLPDEYRQELMMQDILDQAISATYGADKKLPEEEMFKVMIEAAKMHAPNGLEPITFQLYVDSDDKDFKGRLEEFIKTIAGKNGIQIERLNLTPACETVKKGYIEILQYLMETRIAENSLAIDEANKDSEGFLKKLISHIA